MPAPRARGDGPEGDEGGGPARDEGGGPARPLTVAVTGPTGEIGKPFIAALERSRDIARIVGMARRPFDPAAHGWRRTEYRQGDVLDRQAVERLVAGADVVVHLAFIVLGASRDTHRINVEGSRNVFEATVRAGAERLVYASSVAAYGFPAHHDGLLTEDMPPAGHDRHPYSAHKAEVEAVLAGALAGGSTDAYVFRPCIVAGPHAPMVVNALPHLKLRRRLPPALRPLLVLPSPKVAFQLVHHDDVALALRAGVLGRGTPGAYNLAGPGELTVAEFAEAIGVRSVPVPAAAVETTARLVSLAHFLPAQATWIEALRRPVIMDTSKARRELRWRPRHDARETLRQTVEAVVAAA
jgi:UDP-glucose 4-epimerase